MSQISPKTSVNARIILRSMEYDLESTQEFCKVAHNLFTKRLTKFEAKYAAEESPSDEAIDVASEQLDVLRGHVAMSAHYGVLMVFAAWERFMHEMYELTRFISTIPQLRSTAFDVDKKWLRADDYQRYFKQFGMIMPSPAFPWQEIEVLKVYRNAIAHQSGLVTEQNVNGLQKCGNSKGTPYRLGDTVDVSAEYVQKSIVTVRAFSRQFVKLYLERVAALGIGID